MADQKKPQRLAELAREILEGHEEVLGLVRGGVDKAIHNGERLIEAKALVKELMGPRKWLAWLKDRIEENERFPKVRTCQGYMQIARNASYARDNAHLGIDKVLEGLAKPLPVLEVAAELEAFREAGGTDEQIGYTTDEVEDILDEAAAEQMLNKAPTASYAETDEQRDARDKTADYAKGVKPMVEMVMMVSLEESVKIGGYINTLREHYVMSSQKDVVKEALKREARRAPPPNQVT